MAIVPDEIVKLYHEHFPEQALHIIEQKREHTRMLAADVTYRIVAGDDGLALDLKVIQLIDSDEAQHGIAYLL